MAESKYLYRDEGHSSVLECFRNVFSFLLFQLKISVIPVFFNNGWIRVAGQGWLARGG